MILVFMSTVSGSRNQIVPSPIPLWQPYWNILAHHFLVAAGDIPIVGSNPTETHFFRPCKMPVFQNVALVRSKDNITRNTSVMFYLDSIKNKESIDKRKSAQFVFILAEIHLFIYSLFVIDLVKTSQMCSLSCSPYRGLVLHLKN